MKKCLHWCIAGLGIAVLLAWMRSGEQSPALSRWMPQPVAPSVALAQAPVSTKRAERLPPRAAKARAEPQRKAERDPALSAVPADAPSLVVLEAGTLFELPVGRMILRCLQKSGALANDKQNLSQVKRMVFAQLADGSRLTVVSGDRDQSDGEATVPEDRGQSVPNDQSARGQPTVKPRTVQRHGDLLLRGDDSAVRGALSRLESSADQAGTEPNEEYGDAHGRLTGQFVSRLLPPSLAETVARSDVRFEFHVDGTDGIQLTLDALGAKTPAGEMAQAIARALETMKDDARVQSDRTLMRLLDSYTLSGTADGFRLEATLPLDLVAEVLGKCAESGDDASE